MSVLVWLRRDLRLDDNPALNWAVAQGGPVYVAYIHAPEEAAPWAPGAASRWWQQQSLRALAAALRERGGRLLLRRGPSEQALRDLLRDTGADTLAFNRVYEPALVARDQALCKKLEAADISVHVSNGSLLHEPWTIATKSGGPYKVFSPYWKACLELPEPAKPEPLDAQARFGDGDSLPLHALELLDEHRWHEKLHGHWTPGEAGARQRLADFVDEALADYPEGRDRPDRDGTSRLSPHLHHGELSPRQVWQATRGHAGQGQRKFRAELGWREFGYHLLWHFPETPQANFNPRFNGFSWRAGQAAGGDLEAWQRGQTGIDIIDAGMRQLWASGWMHNRVRMLVGSLLTKNLGIHWREGARWFWDTLVDADLANNTLGWQWVAGCGADAAPYFRIFNPETQAERHDPDGAYRRRWLRGAASPDEAIVDLKASREAALAAYQDIRAGSD